MQTSKQQPKRRPPIAIPKERSAHDAELVDDMADLLDEIDAILEDQEHLRRFRQRGGE